MTPLNWAQLGLTITTALLIPAIIAIFRLYSRLQTTESRLTAVEITVGEHASTLKQLLTIFERLVRIETKLDYLNKDHAN